MKNKGVFFTIDALIALMFIGLLGIILFIPIYDNTKEFEINLINNRISDLLITSQLLEINDIKKIEENYIKLFNKKPGYIILDTKKIEINKNKEHSRKISQNTRYFNSSNKEIYIEIGVYH